MKEILRMNRGFYFLLAFLSMARAFLMIIFSIQLGQILDLVGRSEEDLGQRVFLCLGSIFLWFLSSWCHSYLKSLYVKKVLLAVKERRFSTYLAREMKELELEGDSEFLNQVTKTMDLLQENFLLPRIAVVSDLTSLVMSLLAIFWIEWRLALVFLSLSSLTLFLSQIPGRLMAKATDQYSLMSQDYLANITNLIGGFEQIVLLNRQDWAEKRMGESSYQFEEARKIFQYRKDLATNVGTFLSFLSQVLCMIAGIFFVRKGLLTVGLLVASIQLLNGVFGPLQSFLYHKNLMTSAKSILREMEENLESGKNRNRVTDVTKNQQIREISISNLSYQLDKKVLFHHFSFEFKKGKKYAIIGPSGIGKSTLAKLILNYVPQEAYQGLININGKGNAEWTGKDLYQEIAYVQKNDFLIEGSVFENIRLGRKLTLRDSLKRTLDFKQDFIAKKLSPGKNTISQGEKQRVDLARFLSKPYSAYIFDEPTSNLDPARSKVVMDLICSLEDVLVIVITHDQDPDFLVQFDEVLRL